MSDTLQQRLDSFRALQPGWDGEDAKPITEEALALAGLLLRSPEIAPTVEGGIWLSWEERESEGGLCVEIEALPDGMLEVLLTRGDNPVQEWDREAQEAAESWQAMMAEPVHEDYLADVQAFAEKVEQAIEEDAEERRLLLAWEDATRRRYKAAADGRIWEGAEADEAWLALQSFRARQKGSGQ